MATTQPNDQTGPVFHNAPTELVSVAAGFCSTSFPNVVPLSANARCHRENLDGELSEELSYLDNRTALVRRCSDLIVSWKRRTRDPKSRTTEDGHSWPSGLLRFTHKHGMIPVDQEMPTQALCDSGVSPRALQRQPPISGSLAAKRQRRTPKVFA